MPVTSIARPINPPSASISRTICPLPTPPIAGLQLICPTVSQLVVSSAVRAPSRAAAYAASAPACPAPTTITSKSYWLLIPLSIAAGSDGVNRRHGERQLLTVESLPNQLTG